MATQVYVNVVGPLDASGITELTLERPDGGSTEGWEIRQSAEDLPVVYVSGDAVKTTPVGSDVDGKNGVLTLRVELPEVQ